MLVAAVQPRRRFGAPGLSVRVAGRRRATEVGDELGERLAGPLLERGALRLAMIREHHQLVRPWCPTGDPLDASDLTVDVA